MEPDERYMTVEEAARYLGFEKQTIYNKIHTRQIPFHKVGPRAVRFKRDEIDKWINEQRIQQANYLQDKNRFYRKCVSLGQNDTTDPKVYFNRLKEAIRESWEFDLRRNPSLREVLVLDKNDFSLARTIVEKDIVYPILILDGKPVYGDLDRYGIEACLKIVKIFRANDPLQLLMNIKQRALENAKQILTLPDSDELEHEGEEAAYVGYQTEYLARDFIYTLCGIIGYLAFDIKSSGQKVGQLSAYANRYFDEETLLDLYLRDFCYFIRDPNTDWAYCLKERSIFDLSPEQLIYANQIKLFPLEDIRKVTSSRIDKLSKELAKFKGLKKLFE